MIAFKVEGNPIPKQSFRYAGPKGAYSYQEPRVTAWEQSIGIAAKEAMQGQPPIVEPVTIHLNFYRKDARTCDIDNLSKAVLDGMKGVVYVDDKQVNELHLFKCTNRRVPHVEVTVHTEYEQTCEVCETKYLQYE